MKKQLMAGFLLLLWATLILAAFFVFQKPASMQLIGGLGSLAWTIFLIVFIVFTACGLGCQLLAGLGTDRQERLLLGAGLGLGVFGLVGFGLAAFGLAKPAVLLAVLFVLFFWQVFTGVFKNVWQDTHALLLSIINASTGLPFWMPLGALLSFLLTFVLALAPPADGFDSLLYHLTVPAMWLRDGGFRLINMPHYWFPSLVEGIFVWPMGLGNDIVPQLLHMFFGILTGLLIWHWARVLWGGKTAWWALILFLAIPSITWLASWAYTDLALSFFTLSMLYSLWKWQEGGGQRWIWVMAAFSGFAMGVKYTSFVVPLFAGCFLLARLFGKKRDHNENSGSFLDMVRFGGISLLIASPWYLRNWVWMHNPFYPFVFGGPFWDSFRANWYASVGTGLGWKLPDLLLLPFSVTFGSQEISNNFDSKIGPFFLILIPVALWVLWMSRREEPASQHKALLIVSLFSGLSALVWGYGVFYSANLWQGRLLIPGIIPFVLPMALAVQEIRKLDTKELRVSFIFPALVGMFLFINLLDFGLLVAVRNPLLAAVGAEKRQDYMRRIQPGYAGALELVDHAPADAHIYILFEPRSYEMDRSVFPDILMDNLAHDFFQYKTAEKVLEAWRKNGYTHVLIFSPGFDGLKSSNHILDSSLWVEIPRLLGMLTKIGVSSDGNYALYSIPASP